MSPFLRFLSIFAFLLVSIANAPSFAQYLQTSEHVLPFSGKVTSELPDMPSEQAFRSFSPETDNVNLRNNPEYNWQHPLLTANRLTGLVHVTNDIILVSGNNGTILKSLDAGINWENLQGPFPNDIMAIDAWSNNRVAVASRGGLVAVTQDLGLTWTIKQAPTAEDLRNIKFFGENSIMATGNNKTAYYSLDLGNTWQQVIIPEDIIFNPNNRPTWTYRSIAVTNNAIFIGIDGSGMPIQVIKSVDSGLTWTQFTALGINPPGSTLGLGVTELTFSADGTTGFGSFRSGLGGGIIKTTDGGNSWSRIVIDEFTPLPDPDNPYISQTVQIRSSINVSADGQKIISGGLFGQVLASVDGGSTWYEIYGGVRQGYRDFHAVDFPAAAISSDNKWLVAGTRGIITGADTFSAGSGSLRNGDEHNKTFRSLFFYDNNNGIAVGFRTGQKFTDINGTMIQMAIGLYLTTSDAGQTWTAAEGPEGMGYRWHSIQKDENNRLYIAGLDYSDGVNINGIIIGSDDQGLTWQVLANSSEELGAMNIWDSENGYAIGFGNKFLSINEQGNWESSTMPSPVSPTNSLNSIDVLGPEIVFVGGGNPSSGGTPYIFRSLDGGQQWEQVFSHANTGRISVIKFMDAEFGMAGGAWGPTLNRQTILVTKDYGDTWNPVPVSFVGAGSSEVLAFNIANESHITAYAANGHIVESINNEDLEFFGHDFKFTGISFLGSLFKNGNEGWVTGDDCAIIKYQKADPVNTVPARFANIFPLMGQSVEITAEGVVFQWTPSYDPDGGTVSYELMLQYLEDETDVTVFTTTENNFTLDTEAAAQMLEGMYSWRVVATDGDNYSATTFPHEIQISIDGTLSGENKILSFELTQQTSAAIIDNQNFTVDIEVTNGTDVSSLSPVITVSEGATSDPGSEQTIDFSSPVTYTVTAENGDTQPWVVTVHVEYIPADDATLADLTVAGATIEGFDTQTTQYYYTLPQGSLTPPVVAAVANDPNATVSVQDATDITSAEEEDRTTSVTVVAEDGETQLVYNVTFDIQTSINDLAGSSISVFPNPSQNIINVSAPGTVFTKAQLITLSGKVLWEQTLPSENFSIPAAQFGNGLFLLRLNTDSNVIIRKVQVIH